MRHETTTRKRARRKRPSDLAMERIAAFDELRREWRTQLAAGGYCTPPGPAMCALQRARARLAIDNDARYRFVWEEDQDVDLSWDDDGRVLKALESGEYTSEYCALQRACGECGSWKTVAALGGIIGPPSDYGYRRTIEADLAIEALASASARDGGA